VKKTRSNKSRKKNIFRRGKYSVVDGLAVRITQSQWADESMEESGAPQDGVRHRRAAPPRHTLGCAPPPGGVRACSMRPSHGVGGGEGGGRPASEHNSALIAAAAEAQHRSAPVPRGDRILIHISRPDERDLGTALPTETYSLPVPYMLRLSR